MPNFLSGLVVFFISLVTFAGPVSQGQEGHGGDIAVSIFMGVAQELGDVFLKQQKEIFPGPQFTVEFHQAFLSTKIFSVEKTVLNGMEVDAINYPDIDNPRILINRTRWLDNQLSMQMRSLLVLHEYLSIMGYDDSHYLISYPLINNLGENL